MRTMELWVSGYLLNSLWQAPLVFAAAWLAARMVRALGPRAEHRVWVSALIAQAVLPLCDFRISALWDTAQGWVRQLFVSEALHADVRVVVGAGHTSEGSELHLPTTALTVVTAVYGCCLLFIAMRLAWGFWKTRGLSHGAEYLTPASQAGQRVNRRGHRFRIDATQIAVCAEVPGPMTVGILRRVLLLPSGFLEKVSDIELDTVLSHEAAHMRRWDFTKNLLYRLVSLPAAWHPATWQTMTRVAESREMVCDAMAAESIAGRESYARALLRLASMLSQQRAAVPLHAIGIFDANIFERRVMRLTGKQKDIRGARRLATLFACAALGVGTCASAVALSLHVDTAARASEDDGGQTARPKKVMVSSGVMAANKLSGVTPVYPVEAKKARIQGTVVLKTTIGTDGKVEDLEAVSGPKELQLSAVDAVRQWTYKPYLLNGEPIEVETQVNVIYTLAK